MDNDTQERSAIGGGSQDRSLQKPQYGVSPTQFQDQTIRAKWDNFTFIGEINGKQVVLTSQRDEQGLSSQLKQSFPELIIGELQHT
jgi:hypothetical protein